MSWAWPFGQFWRAAFPLMKRQRAESLAERELSLLPLIGHRRAEDLGGRVQVEFNLVAGSELVRPWSLWSGWPREGQSLGEAQRELEQHASPLIHPLSQQFRRDPRVREPSVQPVSLAEERCEPGAPTGDAHGGRAGLQHSIDATNLGACPPVPEVPEARNQPFGAATYVCRVWKTAIWGVHYINIRRRR